VKTVQLTLDEPLVEEVDKVVQELGTSRSAFAREALRAALARRRVEALEKSHRAGYEQKPVEPSEVHEWEEEQVWPD
jgi:metal-responsive CopG/Arc/MetJ family transcriptional regulator